MHATARPLQRSNIARMIVLLALIIAMAFALLG